MSVAAIGEMKGLPGTIDFLISFSTSHMFEAKTQHGLISINLLIQHDL